METILIIGASGGIGNKVASSLLDKGYSVIGTYYQHQENLEGLSKIPNFTSYYLDLKNPNSIGELKNRMANNPLNLFAVINCAGICKFEGENVNTDIEIWQETVATNLSGNYYLAKYMYNLMSENGRFILLSSTDAFYGGDITASYAASKAGVNSLTKSLSLLFRDKKIRTNAVAPGWVETPMITGNAAEFIQKVAGINPLKRNAQPEDVAKLICFLLSTNADYINGQVIPLEGGYTNQDPTLLLESESQQG